MPKVGCLTKKENIKAVSYKPESELGMTVRILGTSAKAAK